MSQTNLGLNFDFQMMMRLFILILFLILTLQGRTEGYNTVENNLGQTKEQQQLFANYADTIKEYLSKDMAIALDADQRCQELLSKGLELPDSTYVYCINKEIYLHHTNQKPIEAFREISNCEKRLDEMEVSHSSRKTFNYLYGYTMMALGQWDAAQERFYFDLKNGIQEKDTSMQFFALYSLGQIYNQQKEYTTALEYNNRAHSLLTSMDDNSFALASIQLELANTYANLEQLEASMEMLNLASQTTDKNELGVLSSRINIKKGHIHLRKNELAQAMDIYGNVRRGNESYNNKEVSRQSEVLYAHILVAKSEFKEALALYIKLIDQTEPTDLVSRKELVWRAQEIAKKSGDHTTAYRLFTDYNNIANEIDSNFQSIQSEYFKIKFDTKAKERENAKPVGHLKSKDHESIHLYLWLALLSLFMLGLVVAYYQRDKYSKRLEYKVHERTAALKESVELLDRANEELTDFNRILSHNLKEPLRGMIGFSQLLLNELDDKSIKGHEYLNYIIRSGYQLDQLIDSINHYQKAAICESKISETLDVKSKIYSIIGSVNENHPDKEIDLLTNANCEISFCNESFESIFHIMLDNALRYNIKKKVRIDVDYSQTPDYHEFEVSDNGIGIPVAHRGKVFAKFQRANSSITSMGAGMGLSIVCKLLESIGGSISLKDKAKLSGSTFLVRIPIYQI